MFVKISEQPSLYNDLEKKSVREILGRHQQGRPESGACRTKGNTANREISDTNRTPHETRRTHFLYGMPAQAAASACSTPPKYHDIRHAAYLDYRSDSRRRHCPAQFPWKNAEDDMQRGWEELVERNITDKDTVIGDSGLRYNPLRYRCAARSPRAWYPDGLHHQQSRFANGCRIRCTYRNDCRT